MIESDRSSFLGKDPAPTVSYCSQYADDMFRTWDPKRVDKVEGSLKALDAWARQRLEQ
ncbi:hypothetical protein [Ralstonia solanacearum]|uniref:Uncharacterized protein n=1 Tax=Ralstonia solanacearum TaxID=305 RepID=A0A7X0PYB9_RALSL|nr:hypothetical protein [Ralstonia solanacearum]MBB6581962.1 hypothetical protein [Ralstonia solanacearum]MBB6584669.1 hypothetical protein [Ralstonia solanacearum]MDB0524596.1 hypothetical protein [Ralstonia solanacearum]